MTRFVANAKGTRKQISSGVLPFALLTLVACSARAPASVLDEVPASPRRARLSVRNQHRHAVRVVAVPDQATYDLGVVRPTSMTAVRLPQVLNGLPLRVLVHCVVENTVHQTRLLSWEGEQVIELEVFPLLNMTTVNVHR